MPLILTLICLCRFDVEFDEPLEDIGVHCLLQCIA